MNWSLKLGIFGTAILLFVIIFGPMLSLHDMQHKGSFQQIVDAHGAVSYAAAPFPPSAAYPLGTDDAGRDMLSILLQGARVTVGFAVAVAVIRVLLALPIAYLGAAYPRAVGWLNERLNLAFTTIPMVLFVYLIMSIYNLSDSPLHGLTIKQNLIATGLAAAVAGVFQTVGTLQASISSIMKHPFMEGLVSVGTGKWRILRKHILPHLSSQLGILLVTEIAQTLWLLTQLGVIYVFLGGAYVYPQDTSPIPNMRLPEEWAGAIGRGYLNIRYHPMVTMYPLLALTLAMLSFNLLADGIRKRNNRQWGYDRG